MKKIYVGNLSWGTTDRDLETLFSGHGEVRSATVITDRDTGRSRGFGFVEMEDQAANEAISALNDKEVDGRRLKVNEAKDRPAKDRGGDRGGRAGGGGGGGGRWKYPKDLAGYVSRPRSNKRLAPGARSIFDPYRLVIGSFRCIAVSGRYFPASFPILAA